MVQKYRRGNISVCPQSNRRIPGLWVKIRCLVATMDDSSMNFFLFPKLFILIKLHVKRPFLIKSNKL